MIGTLINTALIIAGSLLGLLIRRGIPQRVQDALIKAMGLSTVLIGLSGALKTGDTLCMIVCMGLGSLIGSLLNPGWTISANRWKSAFTPVSPAALRVALSPARSSTAWAPWPLWAALSPPFTAIIPP